MRDLEGRLAGSMKNDRSRHSPASSQAPPLPPPPAVPTRSEVVSDRRPSADEGSMLSQMDMRRASQGGGKGKPGGLKDMWDSGGGGDGGGDNPILPGGARWQQQQLGGGLTDAWQQDGKGETAGAPGASFAAAGRGRRHSSAQQTRRQGPGLKDMWGGEKHEEAPRPQREGPGLRGLWSGPDLAAADAARSEAQAAYFSALNRDLQERRTFSNDPQEEQGQRQRQRQQQVHGGREQSQGVPPYGVTVGGVSEYGTSLAGIGTPRGGTTPRQQRREFSEGSGGGRGGGNLDRAADRAKKAAYADELRKQMAEREARMAMDETSSGGRRSAGRRRASTGRRDGGGHGAPATPRSYGCNRESFSLPGQSVPDGIAGTAGGGAPLTGADPIQDRWPSAAWSTPPTSGGGGGGGGGGSVSGGVCASEGRVTAARRRLVEDVYGGGGMEAALGGAGYRRASTGSHDARGRDAAGPGASRLDHVGERGGGESRASTGLAGGAPSYLRTGAGVQSLHASEQGDGDKLLKRAAALEQQRALEEQIAAKARAKKEEEDKRKREEEEDARCVSHAGWMGGWLSRDEKRALAAGFVCLRSRR